MEYVVIAIVLALSVGARLAMSWGRMRGELDLQRPVRDLTKRGRRLDASSIAEVAEATVGSNGWAAVSIQRNDAERSNLTAMGKSE